MNKRFYFNALTAALGGVCMMGVAACASTAGSKSAGANAPAAVSGTYTFGTSKGAVAVSEYKAAKGIGFTVLNGGILSLKAGETGITASKSFQFKIAAPNGNYEVSAVTSATEIISEAITEPVVYIDENGTKNSYNPPIDTASGIPLIGVPKTIESGKSFYVAVCDGVLDLTFIRTDSDITLSSITIKALPQEKREKPWLIAIGDSTTNLDYQDKCSWGNVIDKGMVQLPDSLGGFFNAGSSGADDITYIAWSRLEAALLHTAPGDYVTVNMGINQAKKYKIGLMEIAKSDSRGATLPLMEKYYVEGILQRGGIPVITTITARGPYDKAGTPEDNGGLFYSAETKASEEVYVAGRRYASGQTIPANTWSNSRHNGTYNIRLYDIANNYGLQVIDLGIWGEGFFQSLTEENLKAFNAENNTDFATVFDMVKHGYYADQNHYHSTLGVVFANYMLSCVDSLIKGTYSYPYWSYEPCYLKKAK